MAAKKSSKPIAVCISDVHYSLNTYQLADIAMRLAIDKAASLGVPLVDCGDLTNDKAILRAECVNTLLETFKYAQSRKVQVYCLVGNHSLVNEKGTDHALNFLRPYATIIDKPMALVIEPYFNFIPYQPTNEKFMDALAFMPKGAIVFTHQGFNGAKMGDYTVDRSSVSTDAVKDFKVISGHYHQRQELGTVTYVGNPYTLTFGEANDGLKGFITLFDDGSYMFNHIQLRKHVVYECDVKDLNDYGCIPEISAGDLLWVKVYGPKYELDKVNKSLIAERLVGHKEFKLDKIPDALEVSETKRDKAKKSSHQDLLDQIIDESVAGAKDRARIKKLWRSLT